MTHRSSNSSYHAKLCQQRWRPKKHTTGAMRGSVWTWQLPLSTTGKTINIPFPKTYTHAKSVNSQYSEPPHSARSMCTVEIFKVQNNPKATCSKYCTSPHTDTRTIKDKDKPKNFWNQSKCHLSFICPCLTRTISASLPFTLSLNMSNVSYLRLLSLYLRAAPLHFSSLSVWICHWLFPVWQHCHVRGRSAQCPFSFPPAYDWINERAPHHTPGLFKTPQNQHLFCLKPIPSMRFVECFLGVQLQ